jgi:hypothetical protein
VLQKEAKAMMTKREKKTFYTRALVVVVAVLVIPMIAMLVGGGKSPSPDEVQKCVDAHLAMSGDLDWDADTAAAHLWVLKFCSE